MVLVVADTIPLCDVHPVRMRPAALSFLPSLVFECADLRCPRHYGFRFGYFSLLPRYQTIQPKIDPVGRFVKFCPVSADRHSFLVITSHGDGSYWWHCFDCHRNHDRVEYPFR
jgi:hypothetical protein